MMVPKVIVAMTAQLNHNWHLRYAAHFNEGEVVINVSIDFSTSQ